MKLHHVPASAGLLWVKQGIRTFWRQPLALAGMFFMFMLTVSLLSMVPWIGPAVALALLPAASLGLMAGTREAEQGRFPMPHLLLSAFRTDPARRKAMLTLGLLYALGSLLVMGLSALLNGGDFTQLGNGTEITEEVLQQPAFTRGLMLNLVLYAPLALLFWHAPALVYWHGIAPQQSLFYSFMACWGNKGALCVFFLGWTAVFIGTAFVIVFIGQMLGGPQAMAALMFPLAMLLSAMFFASVFFSFRDSFTTDDDLPPA
ncbi:MAG TPA: BPSS1780 family membrane protein [Macromonas sp.]|nr:BPSS1780 family membrane protein [Macromonas sp.]